MENVGKKHFTFQNVPTLKKESSNERSEGKLMDWEARYHVVAVYWVFCLEGEQEALANA